jgi:20S proteasome subunit beta 1
MECMDMESLLTDIHDCCHFPYLVVTRIQTGRPPLVKTAAHLMQGLCYKYKDRLSAGVIVAGWDPVDGGSVYNIPAGGMCLKIPFSIGGSGSLFIYGLVDATYNPNATLAETRDFVKKCVSHAMARDGSSGGVIRTILVTAQGHDRDYTPGNALPYGPTGN